MDCGKDDVSANLAEFEAAVYNKWTLSHTFSSTLFVLNWWGLSKLRTHISYILLKLQLESFVLMLINRFSPAGIYLIKMNNRNTRTMGELCPKLTIKHSGAFIMKFKQTSPMALVFLLSTLNNYMLAGSEWRRL